jgi:MraZ protein
VEVTSLNKSKPTKLAQTAQKTHVYPQNPIEWCSIPCYPYHLSVKGRYVRFVSTYDAGLDDKRRVTVPADFRAGLKSGDGAEHVRIWPGEGAWLEGADDGFIAALSQSTEELADDDPDLAEAATLAILGGSRKLSIDTAGRMVLPESFVAHAGLSDRVAFQGLGPYFRITSAETGQAMAVQARETTKAIKPRIFAMARRKVREGQGS